MYSIISTEFAQNDQCKIKKPSFRRYETMKQQYAYVT